jgi:rhomboid protease GluP
VTPRRDRQPATLRHAVYASPEALAGAPVTRAIVWANVAIFALEVLASRSGGALGEVPSGVLHLLGSNDAVVTFRGGAWFTLVTACFLHGSLLHVAMNMYALRQIGPLVEGPVGSARFAVMYVVTGIVASATSCLWALWRGVDVNSVGASGAICGAMGAAVIVGLRLEGWRSGIAWNVGFWLAVTIAYGAISPHIDNAAHVGGLACGVVIAATWRRGVVESPWKRLTHIGASALVVLASFALVLVRDTNDPYAAYGPDDLQDALDQAIQGRDCAAARKLLGAVERLEAPDADHESQRAAVDAVCPATR